MGQVHTKPGSRGAPGVSLQRAHQLIAATPRTRAELSDLLGINRNSAQKLINQLKAADLIHPVGQGYAGAVMWGVKGTPMQPAAGTRKRLGLELVQGGGEDARQRVTRAQDHRAGGGVLPDAYDHLIVTGVGVVGGHAVVKLQRGDGTTWVMGVVDAS